MSKPKTVTKRTTKKRAPGKPGRGGNRPLYIIISVTAGERRAVKARARKAGAGSMSEWVRTRVGIKE